MIEPRIAGVLLVVLVAVVGAPAAADWAEVRRAFEAGDAVALIAVLRPLAESGDADAYHILGQRDIPTRTNG